MHRIEIFDRDEVNVIAVDRSGPSRLRSLLPPSQTASHYVLAYGPEAREKINTNNNDDNNGQSGNSTEGNAAPLSRSAGGHCTCPCQPCKCHDRIINCHTSTFRKKNETNEIELSPSNNRRDIDLSRLYSTTMSVESMKNLEEKKRFVLERKNKLDSFRRVQ